MSQAIALKYIHKCIIALWKNMLNCAWENATIGTFNCEFV